MIRHFYLVLLVSSISLPSVAQSEKYLSALDSATSYFAMGDFNAAKKFYKVCIDTDDFKRVDLYYLASCFSKLAMIDSSAYYFNLALSMGLRSPNVAQIDNNPNIDNLITSRYWKDLRSRFIKNSTVSAVNEALQRALAERYKMDQQYSLQANVSSKVDQAAWKQQEEINKRNQAWLDSVVSIHGWPTISLVGEEGSIYAWLIVQHADNDPAFQKKYLEMTKRLIKTNDIPLSNYAYLMDRVLLNDCLDQLYGTQFSVIYAEDGQVKSIEFKPITQSKWVDKRRRYMNMVPLEDYRKEALEFYRSKQSR